MNRTLHASSTRLPAQELPAQELPVSARHPGLNGRSDDRLLSPDELTAFGAELDALQQRVRAALGEADHDYIQRVRRMVRYSGLAGRGLLFLSCVPPLLVPAWLGGTSLLALSKILENMELGHNVMHGQYSWTGDPALQGNRYEWDNAGTSDNWRKSHNYQHHTYTNVRGMDDDVGYGILRLFPEQRWKPFYLAQLLYVPIFATLFEFGIAIQELRLGRVFTGRKSREELKVEARPVLRKINGQLLRDYLLYPLLAGPFFLTVLLGNLAANTLRNLWTFLVIFCGHFTENAVVFPREVLEDESRGSWYLRQLRGSSNLRGGRWFHILTGHLSHQIEHHLFPDLPAHRYPEMAEEVRAICHRYGQYYNCASLPRQAGQVLKRLIRHGFPSRVVPGNKAASSTILV